MPVPSFRSSSRASLVYFTGLYTYTPVILPHSLLSDLFLLNSNYIRLAYDIPQCFFKKILLITIFSSSDLFVLTLSQQAAISSKRDATPPRRRSASFNESNARIQNVPTQLHAQPSLAASDSLDRHIDQLLLELEDELGSKSKAEARTGSTPIREQTWANDVTPRAILGYEIASNGRHDVDGGLGTKGRLRASVDLDLTLTPKDVLRIPTVTATTTTTTNSTTTSTLQGDLSKHDTRATIVDESDFDILKNGLLRQQRTNTDDKGVGAGLDSQVSGSRASLVPFITISRTASEVRMSLVDINSMKQR